MKALRGGQEAFLTAFLQAGEMNLRDGVHVAAHRVPIVGRGRDVLECGGCIAERFSVQRDVEVRVELRFGTAPAAAITSSGLSSPRNIW